MKLFKRTAAVITALMMLFECIPAFAANDTTSIPGWTVEISGGIDGGAYVDSSEKASGKNSMRLYNNTVKTSDTTFLRASYPIAVKKGRQYKYGFKVKAKNAVNVTTQMNWITPRASLVPTGKNSDWRSFEFVYNHPGADGTAYLRIILDTKTEAVWIDDMYFYDADDSSQTNLINNPGFEETAAKPVSSDEGADGRRLIPVYNKSISIDGDLSDWEGTEAFEMDQRKTYAGTLTLDSKIRYAYDAENFYFAVEAEDETHYPIMNGSYWNGDGLQFTLCGMNDNFGKAYAYSYDIDSGEQFISGSEKLKGAFKRSGTTSVYEIAIPWDDFFADGKQNAALFCCIVNDNDNDGSGRKGCTMVSEGIASYKGSGPYPLMLMIDSETGFDAWLSGTNECYAGDKAVYYADLFNSSDKEISLNLKSEKGNFNEKVTVAPNSSYKYKFELTFGEMGEENVDLTVSDGSSEKSFEVSTTVFANAEITKNIIQKHKANYAELTPLMEQCRNAGMPLDYEDVYYSILGHFVSYMELALEKNDLVRIHHQDKVLTEIYEYLKKQLNAYLDGSDAPIAAPTYVTSDIDVVDKHFEATVDIEGKKEKRPVFFVGTGHWSPSLKDIPILSKFGFNAIQPELGGWSFMSKAHSVRDWSFNSRNNYQSTDTADSTQKHEGGYALKITADEAHKSNYYWYMYQEVNVKPNTTYEYGLWAKSNNSNFSWFTTDKTMSMGRRQWLNGTYDWKEVKNEFTTGENETSVSFMIFNEDKTDGLWIDSCYLREKGSDKNLLKNGGFEDVNKSDEYFEIKEESVTRMANYFDDMAEYNLSGVFSTAPHYIPNTFYQEHPEIASGNAEYVKFIPDHPTSIEYFEKYYRTLMPRLAGKPAFDSIILMNEPTYYTYKTPYYLPIFQQKMEEKYGTIEALNEKWGTDYADFASVEMPTQIETTPRFYDWRVFNDSVLPDFNRRASALIKEYDNNVLTQTKVMQTMGVSTGGRVDGSNNWEEIAPTTDINGCDGWSYYKSPTLDIRAQDIWYDLQTDIKTAPTYNTEEHIIQDGSRMIYNYDELKYNIATMWQGAVHGRGGSIVWFWDREARSESGSYLHNPLLPERPDTVAALGKMTLDLNRLSREIVAIQDEKANIGMLYSINSAPYTNDWMNTIYTAYSAIGENGQKTKFITESQTEKLSEIKTLVVPHCPSVTGTTFEAIKNFVQNGGRLIVFGSDSLSRNEYGEERNKDEVNALLAQAEVKDVSAIGTDLDSKSVDEVYSTISNEISKENYSKITVIDKATGKPLKNCEYLYSEYDGKYVVNICTYRDDDVEVSIVANGKNVGKMTDLIETEDYSDSITIPAYTPVLISFEK